MQDNDPQGLALFPRGPLPYGNIRAQHPREVPGSHLLLSVDRVMCLSPWWSQSDFEGASRRPQVHFANRGDSQLILVRLRSPLHAVEQLLASEQTSWGWVTLSLPSPGLHYSICPITSYFSDNCITGYLLSLTDLLPSLGIRCLCTLLELGWHVHVQFHPTLAQLFYSE